MLSAERIMKLFGGEDEAIITEVRIVHVKRKNFVLQHPYLMPFLLLALL